MWPVSSYSFISFMGFRISIHFNNHLSPIIYISFTLFTSHLLMTLSTNPYLILFGTHSVLLQIWDDIRKPMVFGHLETPRTRLNIKSFHCVFWLSEFSDQTSVFIVYYRRIYFHTITKFSLLIIWSRHQVTRHISLPTLLKLLRNPPFNYCIRYWFLKPPLLSIL